MEIYLRPFKHLAMDNFLSKSIASKFREDFLSRSSKICDN